MAVIVTTTTPASLKNASKTGGPNSPAIFKIETDGGTATTHTFTLGFNPSEVCIRGVTSGLTFKEFNWNSSMPAASVIQTLSTGATTYTTTGGVSASGGVLSLGTNILEASSTYHVTARP